MKKITKTTALHKILHFGRTQQHALIAEGKNHEAYQIEHARNQMLYALVDSIKAVRELMPKMTEYIIDANGFWQYDAAHFVSDESTRNLVREFAAEF